MLPLNNLRNAQKKAAAKKPRKPIWNISDLDMTTQDATISLRIYRPTSETNLPVIVFYHGGGFAIGSVEVYDSFCRDISLGCNCIVVSVEFRLSPEFPFPCGFNDCYEATRWVYKNISTYNGNPEKMILMGDSSGGNFAAAINCKNSEMKRKDFKVFHQILIYPSLDISGTKIRKSRAEFQNAWFYSSRQSAKFRGLYVKDELKSDVRCSPMLYTGPKEGIPTTFIINAEFDPLRDESFDYCTKLNDENISVKLKTYSCVHGFILLDVPEAEQAKQDIYNYVKSIL